MYHQLVFIWVRDPAMFAEYLRELPPIVTRYGGAADLSLRPTAIWADGLALPDLVNLVHYDDKEAYQRFGADADFRRIEPLRAGSVDLMTFEGYLSAADPSPVGALPPADQGLVGVDWRSNHPNKSLIGWGGRMV